MQGVLGLALPPDPLSGPGTFLALLFGGVLAQLDELSATIGARTAAAVMAGAATTSPRKGFRNYVERQTECCASSVVSRAG